MTKTKTKKKKNTSKKTTRKKSAKNNSTKPKQKNSYVHAIIYFVVAAFLALAATGNAGNVGTLMHERVALDILGHGFFTLPLLLVYLGYRIFKKNSLRLVDKIGLVLIPLSILGIIDIFFSRDGADAGGFVGRLIGNNLVAGFDVYFSVILLIGILVAFGLVVFDPNMTLFKKAKEEIKDRIESDDTQDEESSKKSIDEQVNAAVAKTSPETAESKPVKMTGLVKKKDTQTNDDELSMANPNGLTSDYKKPPLSLLQKSSGKPSTGDIKANANIIQRTLANFGIAVEMDEISIGPTVTRYAMKPAQGVRLARIAGLQNELALALAAKSIRIEAPIPGRSLVGIEVPNTTKSMIGLGSLLSEKTFQHSKQPLLISLGKGVSGASHFVNMAKMPHVLVAGATGAGKSVTIHNIVMSLLYANGPDMLRFIMVDPKRVEMTLYKKIPHLLTPVITDPKKAVLALKWAVKEMERRYDTLQKWAVRDIDSYHNSIVAPAYKGLSADQIAENSDLPEKMPYIVVIIDELSDIMSAYPRELEASIVRLAQMSRAVGIHLLLATQRPSVNVITGLIKANVPTRIAMKVASQIDSRTILDSQGAEKLLGKGDMLYKGEGHNEAIRVQCPYVSEKEVKSVVDYIKKNYKFELDDTIVIPDENISSGPGGFSSSDDSDQDPLYEDALQTVLTSKKASTSYLQRKLSIGYSRAARIIDSLEENGVIGPANGSKPREVLETVPEEQTDNASEPMVAEESNDEITEEQEY
jgi:S-DNA-T family DNA segregation ATPase FtsK/SpoIIIE